MRQELHDYRKRAAMIENCPVDQCEKRLLTYEIERLRAALQKIADLVDSEIGEPLDEAIAIATNALRGAAQATDEIERLREHNEILQKLVEEYKARTIEVVQTAPSREAIARIIDPRIFKMDEDCANQYSTDGIKEALRKADAILALGKAGLLK
jgi:hypothetical protein